MRKRSLITIEYQALMSIYILSFFFFGMFYEYCGAIISAVLSVYLMVIAFREKKLCISVNLGIAVGIILLLGYLLSSIYAVDSGMAFIGTFKYLWLVMFLIAYDQIEEERRKDFINVLPYIGGAMCVICYAGYLIPYLQEHLYTNGRLCGFFQYSNTFALFLLVGMIILCDKRKMKKSDYVVTLFLTSGIGISGSRMVMVLAAIVLLILIIRNKNKKLAVFFALVVAAASIYIAVSGDMASVGRITRLSLNESTLVGRVLYIRDALPLLFHHPFGLGYKGYYYMENMIQTGLYYVAYMHSDILQFGLDVGWLPMLIYLYGIMRTLLDKSLDFTRRLIPAVVFIHGLLDFDLAYTSMLLLLLIVMVEVKPLHQSIELKPSGRVFLIPLIIVSALCLYMSVPLVAFYRNDVDTAVGFYPYYTEAELVKLSETSSVDEAVGIADEIIRQNDTCALAWYAKAMGAYIEDDYGGVIRYQKEAIAREPLNREQYDAYEYMLDEGVEYYENMIAGENDIKLIKQYETDLGRVRDELNAIPGYMEDAKSRLSRLGLMIDDQPELDY